MQGNCQIPQLSQNQPKAHFNSHQYTNRNNDPRRSREPGVCGTLILSKGMCVSTGFFGAQIRGPRASVRVWSEHRCIAVRMAGAQRCVGARHRFAAASTESSHLAARAAGERDIQSTARSPQRYRHGAVAGLCSSTVPLVHELAVDLGSSQSEHAVDSHQLVEASRLVPPWWRILRLASERARWPLRY
jgi:hypothetical protein